MTETSTSLGERAKIKAAVAQQTECTQEYISIVSNAQRRYWHVQPVVQRSLTRGHLFYYLCLSIILILSLSVGCGFKLRGVEKFPFKHLYIKGDPRSTFVIEFRRTMRSSPSTKIENDLAKADAILEILSDTRDRQVISLNPEGQVREFSLIRKIQFSLRDNAQNELIPSTEITLTRDITYSDAAVLAKEVEEAQLYQSMEKDIAQQITRRLAAVKMHETKQQLPAPADNMPSLPAK